MAIILSKHSCGKRGRSIFRNKCCIACLIIVVLLGCTLIGAKVWINSILNELEEESLDPSRLTGQSSVQHLKTTEEILKDFMDFWLTVPQDIRTSMRSTFSGFDYQNRPVHILPFGQWDIKGLLNGKEENEKIMRTFADRAIINMGTSIRLRNATEIVIICDMDGYSYGQMASLRTIKFLIQMAKKYEPLFQHLAYGFTVNLDYFSETLVGMMRPIMGESMSRIELYGTNKEKYVPPILRKIPANQLPPSYGGSKDHRPVGQYD